MAAMLAGFVATIALTSVFYWGPLALVDVIGMWGTLFASRRKPIFILGGAAHVALGVAAALVYERLWNCGVGAPTWPWGLAFGLIQGLLALAVLRWLPQGCARMPPLLLDCAAVATVLLGFMLFGLTLAVTYAQLQNT